MQQVECDHCGRTLEFSGDKPRFCGFCGQSLSTFLEPEETLEVKPTGSTGSGNRHTSSTNVIRSRGEGEDLVGKKLGEFRLLREIGRGGMGVVYEAEQLASSRRVAVKLLSPSISHTQAATDRFLREGKLAASLSHPRTTFVYDAGEIDGRFFIAMELMGGETLRDVVEKDGPPSIERAVDWILDVLDGLEAAHRAGIVHRDVKPSNCFLGADERVKVGDFGLSKSLVGDVELTTGGGFMGTPLYAAPEQLRGETITEKTDQYSLGATLFYLLCGQAPFTGDFATAIARIVADPPPTARSLRAEIPTDLSKVVGRMLEKDPSRRFGSLHEIRTALLPFGSGGSSIATLGRRLAAFSLDYVGSSFVAGILAFLLGMGIAISNAVNSGQSQGGDAISLSIQYGSVFGIFAYFVFFEAIWGRGFGKKLMGLRTVSLSGERVGFLRSIVRSLIFPGVSLAFGIWAGIIGSSAQPGAAENAVTVIQSSLVSFGGWLISLLFLATMRSKNGYRGLHELATGTRVISVHVRQQGVHILTPQAATLPVAPSELQLAGFALQRVVAERDNYCVYLGQDTSLERAVWVYVAKDDAGNKLLEELPVNTTRPAREQWLRGGQKNDHRWQAFEAVAAIPLRKAIAQQPKDFRWGFRRNVLLALAEELRAAVNDETLPQQTSVDQVLVDHSGQLKLINLPNFGSLPVATEKQESSTEVDNDNQIKRALKLLDEAYQACRGEIIIPLADQDFHTELMQRDATQESLDWAVDRLRQAVKTPSRLRWDDRLGLLSISMFAELSLYVTAISLIATMPMLLPEGISLIWTLGVPATVLASVPIFLGAYLNGGPVFRFARVRVLRQKDGRPAGRWRCAWRSFLAWFPFMAVMTVLIYVGLVMGNVTIDSDTSQEMAILALTIIAAVGLILLLFVVGLIVALISPRRGIQDLLAGTLLVPE